MYTIYTKPQCPYCVRAKALLDRGDLTYQELVIGRDITVEQVRSAFPERKTVPIIIEDDFVVGGFDDLVESLRSRNPKEQLNG
jgi:glutaredoxin